MCHRLNPFSGVVSKKKKYETKIEMVSAMQLRWAAACCVGGGLLALTVWRRRSEKKALRIQGIPISWSDRNVSAHDIEQFVPLTSWIRETSGSNGLRSHGNVAIEEISILSAFKPAKRIMFLHCQVCARMHHKGRDVTLPGIVTFRGKSVAALLWSRNEKNDVRILLLQQPRVAAARFVWEAPAGMLDANTLKGAMFDEIRQETGLTISSDRLVEIGSSLSSPGLLDEEYVLYAAHCPEILLAKAEGLIEEEEVISNVKVFDIDAAPFEDAKLRCLVHAALDKNVFVHNEAN